MLLVSSYREAGGEDITLVQSWSGADQTVFLHSEAADWNLLPLDGNQTLYYAVDEAEDSFDGLVVLSDSVLMIHGDADLNVFSLKSDLKIP